MSMNEEREQTLTTADLAAGAEEAVPAQARGSAPVEEEQTGAEPRTGGARMAEGTAKTEPQSAPLFSTRETEDFRSRWTSVQSGFVDEPRNAVEQADGLVAEMIKQLATVFANERTKLEEQWGRGDDIDTEDLRVALRRYRSFFDRLLSV